MWLIQQLLAVWRERLVRLRALAAEPDLGGNWVWRARARILTFLISRYGDPDAAAREESCFGVGPGMERTLCLVEPVDAPPRARENLGALLEAIKKTNAEARRRLRWRWF